MTGGRITSVGQTVEVDSPTGCACAVSKDVVMPVAEQILQFAGAGAVVEFYTALATHVVCSISIILGPEVARRIVEAAAAQIESAAAGAADAQRARAH